MCTEPKGAQLEHIEDWDRQGHIDSPALYHIRRFYAVTHIIHQTCAQASSTNKGGGGGPQAKIGGKSSRKTLPGGGGKKKKKNYRPSNPSK